jgi:hypothetical protein
MSPHPPFRLARATVFAVVCVSLTLVAHASTSRQAVPPGAVAVGGLLIGGVAWVLAGHERSLITILGGLLGGQFGLHVLFAAAQPSAVHLEHAEHAATRLAAIQPGTGMTLAHLAAAVMSAGWLWRGERAAWSLARRMAALAILSLWTLLTLFEPVPVERPRPARPGEPVMSRPCSRLLRHCLVLRGPPSRSPALCGI